MINELFFLQSYGFSGGSFGNLLNQWEQIGVFSFLLPFLLIFALIYGILSKMTLFGDENNRSINGIIALSVSLMALQFGIVSAFFSDILPRLGIALAGVLVFLVLIGLFGNPNNKGLMNTLMWGSFGIAVLIVLQSLDIFGPGYGGDYFLKFIPYDWLPYIALLVLVAIIISSAKKPSPATPAGHFFKALSGES